MGFKPSYNSMAHPITPPGSSWCVPAQQECGTATPRWHRTGTPLSQGCRGRKGHRAPAAEGEVPGRAPARRPRCWEGDFGDQSRRSSPAAPGLWPPAPRGTKRMNEWMIQGCAGCSSLPPSCKSRNCNLFLYCSGSSRDQEPYSCPVPRTSDPPQRDTPSLCHPSATQCHLQLPAPGKA